MKRFGEAKDDLGLASECILALFGGEEEREGDKHVGALLVAEYFAMIRAFMKG